MWGYIHNGADERMGLVKNPVKDNSIIGFTVKKTMYNEGSEINETIYITGQP